MRFYITFLLVFTLLLPAFTNAAWTVDRDDLDDEIVEDVYIPILFGVNLDDLSPNFAEPRGDGSRSHEGLDIMAPQGTPIVSPTEAIVIRTGEGPSAGKYVYTANPGGETFRYMHLDSIADIKTGDDLEPGDYIGTVGDTGNAPDGVYHLHLEIRDEDNDPLDPYERLVKEFTIKQQISFLKEIFRQIRNDEEYAEFLIETYPEVFEIALDKKYTLPREVSEVLEDSDIQEQKDTEDGLKKLLSSLPVALNTELQTGDSSIFVALLQLYLIYTTEGAERDALFAAGPTGYYGSITSNAVLAYQAESNIPETGVYNNKTRAEMMKHPIILNLAN